MKKREEISSHDIFLGEAHITVTLKNPFYFFSLRRTRTDHDGVQRPGQQRHQRQRPDALDASAQRRRACPTAAHGIARRQRLSRVALRRRRRAEQRVRHHQQDPDVDGSEKPLQRISRVRRRRQQSARTGTGLRHAREVRPVSPRPSRSRNPQHPVSPGVAAETVLQRLRAVQGSQPGEVQHSD